MMPTTTASTKISKIPTTATYIIAGPVPSPSSYKRYIAGACGPVPRSGCDDIHAGRTQRDRYSVRPSTSAVASCPSRRSPVKLPRLGSDRQRLGTLVVQPCQRSTALLCPTGPYGFITFEQWPWGVEAAGMIPACEGLPALPAWRVTATVEDEARMRDGATAVARLAMDAGEGQSSTGAATELP
jgi:hypothetical protein